MATHSINTISIFSGAGMLDAGIKLAFGEIFDCIAYVECEAHAAGVLIAAMESGRLDPASVWSDVRTVCGPRFRHYIREATEGDGVGAVIAGYPCPDFSVAGKRAGVRGVKGSLWWSLAEAIAEYEPELLFLENVGGHTSSGFDTVCSAIRSMGYRIAAGLFTASETGASHKRERLFILADREGVRTESGGGNTSGLSVGRDRMADADGPGLQCGRIEGQGGFPDQCCDDVSDASGQGLPHAELGRITGTPERRVDQGPATTELRQYELPLFPPGPGDLDAWRRILAIDPDVAPVLDSDRFGTLVNARRLYRLCAPGVNRRARGAASRGAFESAFRCIPDGMANRTQQLRLLGNGVAPLEAAYAYTTLGACLWGGQIKS